MIGDKRVVKTIKQGIYIIEIIGLILIAIATTIAGIVEMVHMINKMEVTLGDLLLLFLYLEILAMVAVYLDTGKLPIRFPLYVAIIALARYLILDMKNLDSLHMLAVAGTMFIIGFTIILLRYGNVKFPYQEHAITESKTITGKEKTKV